MGPFRTRFGGAARFAGTIGTERSARGSAAPAVTLALLLIFLVGSTVYIFAAHLFAAPPPITRVGVRIDRQYDRTLYAVAVAFILAQLGIAYAAIRFRDRGQHARYTHGSTALEILWTTITAVVFLGLGIWGSKTWAAVRFTPAPRSAIQIEDTEAQFVFYFRYPGPDGKFGRIDPSLINAAVGNPLGLDPNDPAGKDDIITPTLTVPVNHPIELLVRSQDVIHNFFVRELRLQQDAVPGMVIPIHFTPDRIGKYQIVCTQLCGMGHNTMHSFLNVVSESDYQKFLKSQEAAQ